jgi:hypothetical protein
MGFSIFMMFILFIGYCMIDLMNNDTINLTMNLLVSIGLGLFINYISTIL